MENSFGNKFRISIYGESHAPVIGVKIEGVPAGIDLNITELQEALDRRKYGDLPELSTVTTTPRKETDEPIFKSGIAQRCGHLSTTGETIVIEFKNENIRAADYEQFAQMPRPSHADFVNKIKYGELQSGGGISSGRMTLPLVSAGWIAKSLLCCGGSENDKEKRIAIKAYITSIYGESNTERWPQILKDAAGDKDSVGAVIECKAENMPIGLGEPFFNSMESVLSHLIFSIPGVKGLEFGNGFAASSLRGSQNNDPIIDADGTTKTNNSGGINGGISNGNPLVFRVAVKPTASIGAPQQTFNFKTGKVETLIVGGRHDVCFGLRVPPVVEAVTAIALVDMQ